MDDDGERVKAQLHQLIEQMSDTQAACLLAFLDVPTNSTAPTSSASPPR